MNRAGFLRQAAVTALAYAPLHGRLTAATTPAARLSERFAAFSVIAKGLRGRTFYPGETIPWPVPVAIARDAWTLTFSDLPAIERVRSLGLDGSDAQLTIVSNNVLLERLDDPAIDYVNRDRQVVYNASTTAASALNRWRVRPALVTEAARGETFDELRFDLGGPLVGFTTAGEQIRRPDLAFGVRYRVSWYAGGNRTSDLVDPARVTCVSEHPLSAAQTTPLEQEVALFRAATVGHRPVLFVSSERRLEDRHDSYEANFDPVSGVVLMSAHYLRSRRPSARHVLDQLLAEAVFDGASGSPTPELASAALDFAAEANRARKRPASLHPFAADGSLASVDTARVFAVGLGTLRSDPNGYKGRLAALGGADARAARRVEAAIVEVVRTALELNGEKRLLRDFTPAM
ncbi:MAG: hypothetical protein JO064_11470 [Actinobacteria bacterium]|nr:hypothetical protein [Actinomycetota bacterium]MBV8396863.1 hypothetical protein [Actinomycetota bacterium]MBV8599691.1 hypothetical protein [Actinomycetota bacterium]